MSLDLSTSEAESEDESHRDERQLKDGDDSADSRSQRSLSAAATPPRGVKAPAAPPDLEDNVGKTRVDLTDAELGKFRGYAKGSAPKTRDRESWIEALPIVNDVSATAPRLDKSLRGRDMKANLSERQVINLHDGLYSALNLITLSSADNIRGTEEEVKYRDRAQRVLSLLIQDVTVIRRESALASVGIPLTQVSGIRKRTLELAPEKHPSIDDEFSHNLFTNDMNAEISKILKKKEKEKKPEPRLVSFLRKFI